MLSAALRTSLAAQRAAARVAGGAAAVASRRAYSLNTSAERLPSHVLSLPATRVTTLKNGLRVATEETRGQETATVGVWIDAGSAFEMETNNGVAHFLEHMAFKGTARRSRRDIEVEVENLGASLNAYTSREQTVYFAQCLRQDAAACVDILSDILLNSAMSADAIEAERGVILQEKEEVEKQPEEVVFDYLHAAAYQGHGLGRTILGPNRNILGISRAQLVDYVASHYKPHRMVLVGAGGVDHDELVRVADDKFGAMPPAAASDAAGGAPSLESTASVPFTGSEIRLRDDTMEEAHVALAFESVGWRDADYFVMQVIQAIIGQWNRSQGHGVNMSSHLVEKVASEHMAHSLQPFNCAYNRTGLFGVYVVGIHEQLDSLACAVLEEFVRIAYDPTETEVARAKALVKAGNIVDGSSEAAETIGRQMISLGRRISPAEVAMRVDAISTADVKRVARHFFTNTDLAVAAVGNIRNLPDYQILRNWTERGLA